jgi:2-desacetyl-2-hydroxyethyl bacteriochlorophyllide A dehydrogenase
VKRESLYFTGPQAIELRAESLPRPVSGQVLVETIVSAISAGTEMLFYRGEAPDDLPLDSTIGALAGRSVYPLKYGYCAVGRVTEKGSAVDPGWQGRRVFAFNPHESHFLAEPSQLIPLPEDVTPEQAVFLPNVETAINLVMDGHPLIGDQVAVIGQGTVGLLTTSLLARFPLASLVTLDRFPMRREWSLKLGAGASLDPVGPDALGEAKRLLTGERPYSGADLTYELSGSPQALNTAVELTGFDGRVIIGSWYGQKSAEIKLGGTFHRSRIRLVSSQVSTINPEFQGRWDKHRRFQLAWQMIGQIQPERLITHRFNLAEAQQAYRLLAENPTDTLQIVITYG